MLPSTRSFSPSCLRGNEIFFPGLRWSCRLAFRTVHRLSYTYIELFLSRSDESKASNWLQSVCRSQESSRLSSLQRFHSYYVPARVTACLLVPFCLSFVISYFFPSLTLMPFPSWVYMLYPCWRRSNLIGSNTLEHLFFMRHAFHHIYNGGYCRVMKLHLEKIMNYFPCWITNARGESINSKNLLI